MPKSKRDEVPQHQEEALVGRLVEAELLFQLLMNSGSRPCAPRYFELTASTCEPPCAAARAEVAARRAGDARGRAGVGAGELRDHALDRPAGRELHHHERHQHDAEQRRDHEQQAADDVGGHRSAFSSGACAVCIACHRARSSFAALSRIVPPGLRHAAGIARLCRAAGRTRPNRRSSATPCTSAESSSARRGSRGRARGRRWSVRRAISAAMICVDQRVDRRIGDAGEILRALQRGRLRREIGAQRIARRRREAEALDRDVEIEVVDALLRYCTGSTMRSVASMPSVARFLMNGMWCGWNDGSSIRNSIVSGSPFGVDALAVLDRRSRPPAAAARPCAAARGPGPSRRTPAARTARRTPRPAPCRGTARAAPVPPAPGLPFAIMSEFWNTEWVRS